MVKKRQNIYRFRIESNYNLFGIIINFNKITSYILQLRTASQTINKLEFI